MSEYDPSGNPIQGHWHWRYHVCLPDGRTIATERAKVAALERAQEQTNIRKVRITVKDTYQNAKYFWQVFTSMEGIQVVKCDQVKTRQ